MWPLDSLRARRKRRRFEVAFALMAAESTFEALEVGRRAEVEGAVAKLVQAVGLFPAEHRRWAPWAQRNAFRAEAMYRLGIAPKGEGMTWPKFVGTPHIFPTGAMWAFDFREKDAATAEALQYLQRKGTVAASYSPNNSLERTRGK